MKNKLNHVNLRILETDQRDAVGHFISALNTKFLQLVFRMFNQAFGNKYLNETIVFS